MVYIYIYIYGINKPTNITWGEFTWLSSSRDLCAAVSAQSHPKARPDLAVVAVVQPPPVRRGLNMRSVISWGYFHGRYPLVMTNIAMENPIHKWRFIVGKIIYK